MQSLTLIFSYIYKYQQLITTSQLQQIQNNMKQPHSHEPSQSQISGSQCSQNYQQILSSLLNGKKQWLQVPEVVYLTMRAACNYSQQMEEEIYQMRDILTEQSVRIKALEVQVDQIRSLNQIKQMEGIQSVHYDHDTGFKKNKKQKQKDKDKDKGNQSKLQHRSLNSWRGRDTFSNKKHENRSLSVEKQLDPRMLQQLKALAQTIHEKNNEKLLSKLSQLNKTKQQIMSKLQEAQANQFQSLEIAKQHINDGLKEKIRQLQTNLHRKAQSERNSLLKFVQENALEMEKIWIELSQVYKRIDSIVEERFCQQNPNCSQQDDKMHDKTKKYGMKKNIKKNEQGQQDKNYNRIYDLYCSLQNQFCQFKLNCNKQMINFMKAEAVQQIFMRYQSQLGEKISKINGTVHNLQKIVQNKRKQQAMNSQSKQHLHISKNEEKRLKKSDQNMIVIQQSLQNLEKYFKQKLKYLKKQLNGQLNGKVEKQKQTLRKQILEQLEFRQKTICQIVQANYDKLLQSKQKQKANPQNETSLRKAVQKLSEQMIMSRYLHLGEHECKQAILWEKNVYNSMQENFVYKNSQHVITVMAAGLYRLQVGLYPDNQKDVISSFVILNGMPISALKNKEVPPNCVAPSRGFVFNQAILLPAKSKIWIKVQNSFFGQAYLQILKL